jgi:hypothetical protein
MQALRRRFACVKWIGYQSRLTAMEQKRNDEQLLYTTKTRQRHGAAAAAKMGGEASCIDAQFTSPNFWLATGLASRKGGGRSNSTRQQHRSTVTPAHMSFTTRLFRAPAAVSKNSLRCFSTSSPKQADATLLEILESSAAQTPNKSTNNSFLATRFANQAGLTERNTPTREMVESERREQFQRQIFRRWQTGDIYSPHDLTGAEQKKWKFGRKKPQSDAFDVLGINPVNEYKVGRSIPCARCMPA